MLTQRLSELIQACFTGIWIESHEHDDALADITRLCRQENWQLRAWDLEQGLHSPGQVQVEEASGNLVDPLAAVRSAGTLASTDGTGILVLKNFHRFLQSAEIVQALARQVTAGKQLRTFVVILSPVVQIPIELDKLFVVVEHSLPDREQLAEIARGVATEEGELPSALELERVIDAAAGLTRYEAENAFSLSLVRHAQITPETLWGLKSQMMKKSGLVSLHQSEQDFTSLGGLTALKSFCKRAMLQPARNNPHKRPRGILLLGVPGTGKSQFAKCLGKETGRPTLVLDVGALMGGLVGQTESNIRQALKIADAMAPCVLFLDECDKSLSGVNGAGDSGVSTRLFGTLLSYLSDKETDVFVVASANRIDHLPPELTRAERFDGVFFLDLPGKDDRQAIWQLYLQQYELDARQKLPDDTNWTGAEVRACCRLAALLDLPLVQAAQNVVPIAVTAAESVDKLRTWASGRCLSAEQPGIYQKPAAQAGSRRRVARSDASQN
ncbi:AAA family ATPase [Anatilimnocola sp. NA78]|uniref:AAA family ATPase n=1 Tax=Anatilimnocola sp. NA78 TaxID=3415683 RepID=UPI003CE4C805